MSQKGGYISYPEKDSPDHCESRLIERTKADDSEEVKKLLEIGGEDNDPLQEGPEGQSALVIACERGWYF